MIIHLFGSVFKAQPRMGAAVRRRGFLAPVQNEYGQSVDLKLSAETEYNYSIALPTAMGWLPPENDNSH